MAVLKVIEVMANSNKSWEDTAKNAVKHAAKSVKKFVQSILKNSSLM